MRILFYLEWEVHSHGFQYFGESFHEWLLNDCCIVLASVSIRLRVDSKARVWIFDDRCRYVLKILEVHQFETIHVDKAQILPVSVYVLI